MFVVVVGKNTLQSNLKIACAHIGIEGDKKYYLTACATEAFEPLAV